MRSATPARHRAAMSISAAVGGVNSGLSDMADRNAAERGEARPLCRWPQLNVNLTPDCPRSFLKLVDARVVVQIKQAVDLRAMYAELSRKVAFARSGFHHGPIERELGRHDSRECDDPLAALGCRGAGNVLPIRNPALQRCGDRVAGAPERIFHGYTEGRDL